MIDRLCRRGCSGERLYEQVGGQWRDRRLVFRSDMGRFITPGGWWHSAALLGLLTAHGLPASSPALAASSAARSLADSGSSVGGPGGGAGGSGQPLTPVWIGVALLAALLGAAAVGARRRDGVEVRR